MASSTAAQDEFNALVNSQRELSTQHPEDAAAASSDFSDVESPSYGHELEEIGSPDKMRSTYFIPKLRSDANTGPKGVIADAQAFEAAKKQHRFSFARKQNQASSVSPPQGLPRAYRGEDYEKSSGEEDDEDGFMARWRQRRLQELTDRKSGRNMSPASRKTWGTLVKVDAEGFLDAIEQVGEHTVVVVFIYDHAVCLPLPVFLKEFVRLLTAFSLRSQFSSRTAFVTLLASTIRHAS